MLCSLARFPSSVPLLCFPARLSCSLPLLCFPAWFSFSLPLLCSSSHFPFFVICSVSQLCSLLLPELSSHALSPALFLCSVLMLSPLPCFSLPCPVSLLGSHALSCSVSLLGSHALPPCSFSPLGSLALSHCSVPLVISPSLLSALLPCYVPYSPLPPLLHAFHSLQPPFPLSCMLSTHSSPASPSPACFPLTPAPFPPLLHAFHPLQPPFPLFCMLSTHSSPPSPSPACFPLTPAPLPPLLHAFHSLQPRFPLSCMLSTHSSPPSHSPACFPPTPAPLPPLLHAFHPLQPPFPLSCMLSTHSSPPSPSPACFPPTPAPLPPLQNAFHSLQPRFPLSCMLSTHSSPPSPSLACFPPTIAPLPPLLHAFHPLQPSFPLSCMLSTHSSPPSPSPACFPPTPAPLPPLLHAFHPLQPPFPLSCMLSTHSSSPSPSPKCFPPTPAPLPPLQNAFSPTPAPFPPLLHAFHPLQPPSPSPKCFPPTPAPLPPLQNAFPPTPALGVAKRKLNYWRGRLSMHARKVFCDAFGLACEANPRLKYAYDELVSDEQLTLKDVYDLEGVKPLGMYATCPEPSIALTDPLCPSFAPLHSLCPSLHSLCPSFAPLHSLCPSLQSLCPSSSPLLLLPCPSLPLASHYLAVKGGLLRWHVDDKLNRPFATGLFDIIIRNAFQKGVGGSATVIKAFHIAYVLYLVVTPGLPLTSSSPSSLPPNPTCVPLLPLVQCRSHSRPSAHLILALYPSSQPYLCASVAPCAGAVTPGLPLTSSSPSTLPPNPTGSHSRPSTHLILTLYFSSQPYLCASVAPCAGAATPGLPLTSSSPSSLPPNPTYVPLLPLVQGQSLQAFRSPHPHPLPFLPTPPMCLCCPLCRGSHSRPSAHLILTLFPSSQPHLCASVAPYAGAVTPAMSQDPPAHFPYAHIPFPLVEHGVQHHTTNGKKVSTDACVNHDQILSLHRKVKAAIKKYLDDTPDDQLPSWDADHQGWVFGPTGTVVISGSGFPNHIPYGADPDEGQGGGVDPGEVLQDAGRQG
ncbi:unnamed protein product [Closterium sp. NIES-65]|nr:unnamed protein product [Closterium sp. NIES-65]